MAKGGTTAKTASSGGQRQRECSSRPMRPDSFGRILRKLFEGQQPLPWAPHPLSAFMNTEAYRRFNYCAGSGEYTAFEVSGNAAVYLASFTANAPPGVRLWLVDSGSSCFVTPFRDTMILPIHTELQMNGIGGAQSRMVSPLILSFLDADGMLLHRARLCPTAGVYHSLEIEFQGSTGCRSEYMLCLRLRASEQWCPNV